MLFHITMTHTAEDCPGYNKEKFPDIIACVDKIDDIAQKTGVKVHFYVEGAPEHISFALLEAENLSSIIGFVSEIPFRQDFKVTPVMHLKDLIADVKKMMA